MNENDPVEAIARALVVALFPILADALMKGRLFRAACDAILAHAAPVWEAQHGRPAAARAEQILRGLGPATVLTPYGQELFLQRYPLVAIPKRHPPEANENRRASRSRLRQVWDSIWRRRPSSSA